MKYPVVTISSPLLRPGLVPRSEAENLAGKSQDAQFRDFQVVGRAVESLERNGETAFHRGSQEVRRGKVEVGEEEEEEEVEEEE